MYALCERVMRRVEVCQELTDGKLSREADTSGALRIGVQEVMN